MAVVYVGDVILSSVDFRNLVFQQIKPYSPETCLGYLYCQGESYISQSYHARTDCSVLYFLKQLLFHIETFFKSCAKIDLFVTSCHSIWNSLIFLIPG